MVGKNWSRTVLIPLMVTVADIAMGADQQGILCPRCDGSLLLHQPEAERPDLLLGTCDCCQSWSVIELVSEGRAILVEVPGPNSVAALTS